MNCIVFKLLNRLVQSILWRFKILGTNFRKRFGVKDSQWARIVMNEETESFVRALNYLAFDVLEISGERWKNFGFKSYKSTSYPAYDFCGNPLECGHYDLVVAEQVLEHVCDPGRAIQNAYSMLRDGGWLLVTTPFLIKLHQKGQDYWRWAEEGLKMLIVKNGFPEDKVITNSWGNRACVRANLYDFALWIPWFDSLENEKAFPVVIWALAQK